MGFNSGFKGLKCESVTMFFLPEFVLKIQQRRNSSSPNCSRFRFVHANALYSVVFFFTLRTEIGAECVFLCANVSFRYQCTFSRFVCAFLCLVTWYKYALWRA